MWMWVQPWPLVPNLNRPPSDLSAPMGQWGSQGRDLGRLLSILQHPGPTRRSMSAYWTNVSCSAGLRCHPQGSPRSEGTLGALLAHLVGSRAPLYWPKVWNSSGGLWQCQSLFPETVLTEAVSTRVECWWQSVLSRAGTSTPTQKGLHP